MCVSGQLSDCRVHVPRRCEPNRPDKVGHMRLAAATTEDGACASPSLEARPSSAKAAAWIRASMFRRLLSVPAVLPSGNMTGSNT